MRSSFDNKLLKINTKAIKILQKSPKSLLELLTTTPKTVDSLKVSNNISLDLTVNKNNKVTETADTKTNFIANQKFKANLLNKYVFNKFFICCKESRIESPTSFYGCFYIGPFDESLSQTLAHNIRRTLLSQLSGLAITAVEIDGVVHKFSNLAGIKENVLDIICNLQNIVFKENIKPQFALALKNNNALTLQKLEFTAYLRVRGPGIVTSADILLPSGLQCVNPNQYIATLAEDGCLNIKFYISSGQGQNYIKQKQKNTDLDDLKQQFLINTTPREAEGEIQSNLFFEDQQQNSDSSDHMAPQSNQSKQTSSSQSKETNILNYANTTINKNKIYLDSVFMPVTKVNTFVQQNDQCTDDYLENNLLFKFLPREAEELKQSFNYNHNPNQTKEDQDSILVNQTIKNTPLRDLKKQSTNFDAVLKTSQFNLAPAPNISKSTKLLGFKTPQKTASHLKDSLLLRASQYQDVQTFFKCIPNINASHSDNTSNTKYGNTQTSLSESIDFTKINELSQPTQALTTGVFENENLQNSLTFDMSADKIASQQIVVLTEKNKVGETSLNFKKQSHIVVEIWTNGSIHPREALKNCLQFLSNTFVSLENVKMLGSMFKSDVTYTKLLKRY